MSVTRLKSVCTIIFCMVISLFCACNTNRPETNVMISTPMPTMEASVTKSPEPTATPTSTPIPENTDVPINEAYFSSALFREYISNNIDKNKDGVLSRQERENVSFIALRYEYEGECLDGFEHFPNLSSLYVIEGEQVIVKNCASLSFFQIEYGEFKSLQVMNCPKLEDVEIISCAGERAEVFNCPKLRTIYLDNNRFDELSVTEVHGTSVCLNGWVDFDKMVLDRNSMLKITSKVGSVYRNKWKGEETRIYTSVEAFISDAELEWVGIKEEEDFSQEENKEPDLDVWPEIMPVSIPDDVPITEEFFSDVDFRTVISSRYDIDKNGVLSRNEREAVTEIIWDNAEFSDLEGTFDDAVLDGLGAFPNLVTMDVKYAEKVILVNHPSIKVIGGDTGGASFYIQNCPALENMGFSFYGGSIIIRDCENLRRFAAHQTSFRNLVFSGTPQLVVSLERSELGRIQADAEVVIGLDQYQSGLDDIHVGDNGQVALSLKNSVEWNDVAEQSIELSDGYFTVYLNESDVFGMEVMVTECMGESRDEKGRTPWNVRITGRVPDEEVKPFLVYSEEMPTPEQIQIRLNDNTEIEMFEYSPNKVLSFGVAWRFDVVYTNGEEEEIIGRTRKEQWWAFHPDGTKQLYDTLIEWRDNEGYIFKRNMEYYYGD